MRLAECGRRGSTEFLEQLWDFNEELVEFGKLIGAHFFEQTVEQLRIPVQACFDGAENWESSRSVVLVRTTEDVLHHFVCFSVVPTSMQHRDIIHEHPRLRLRTLA